MLIQNSSQPLSSFLERTGPRVAASSVAASRQDTVSLESYAATRESVEASGTSEERQSVTPQLPVFTPASGSTSEQGVSTSGTGTAATTGTSTPPAAETAYSTQVDFAPSQSVDGAPDPTPAAPWPINVVKQAEPPELAGQTKTALLNALVDSGVDPAQLKFSYWEELMWFPGGSVTMRAITVQGPNGQKMDFGAAETLNDPLDTVQSILKMVHA